MLALQFTVVHGTVVYSLCILTLIQDKSTAYISYLNNSQFAATVSSQVYLGNLEKIITDVTVIIGYCIKLPTRLMTMMTQ